MKKSIVLAAAVAAVLGLAGFERPVRAQGGAAAAPGPHKVGLIDMAHIFKNYKKFEALREDLKNEIAQSDNKAKQMATQIKQLDDQLKQMKQGSQGYLDKEKQLLQVNSDFEAFRKGAQRDFMRKESQIYKTIYLEVTDAVEKYAYHYQYTLIMRFNRDEVDGVDDPQEVLARMNRQVVYYKEENDITVPVLEYLNKKYGVAPKVEGGDEPAPKPTPKPAPARTGQK